MKIRERKVPPMVGRREAARLLGVASENIERIAELPRRCQDRGIEGFEVSFGPLWHRDEILELARKRECQRNGR